VQQHQQQQLRLGSLGNVSTQMLMPLGSTCTGLQARSQSSHLAMRVTGAVAEALSYGRRIICGANSDTASGLRHTLKGAVTPDLD
jgi:hypothetical protein